MKEIWKDIKGYEGSYQVSNLGRIKSIYQYNDLDKRRVGVRIKILKPCMSTPGYYRVILCKNSIHKKMQIHRLVAFSFIPNLLNKPQVNHIDGNKINNNVENLEWMTDGENRKHAYKIGLRRHRIGEDATNVRLTEKDVLFIRKNTHLTPDYLAKKYKINSRYVLAIRHRDYWKNI